MRVLVTGATGFIGRRLVPQLLAANVEIVSLAFDDGAEMQSTFTTESASNSAGISSERATTAALWIMTGSEFLKAIVTV